MAYNKSKAKGAKAEVEVRDILKANSGLPFQRVPLSGSIKFLKGDIYIPNKDNVYCIEVKHYKEEQINSTIITSKESQFEKWWNQAVREAKTMENSPLLIFRKDRGKYFVAGYGISKSNHKCIYIEHLDVDILLLDDWLSTKPIFIK